MTNWEWKTFVATIKYCKFGLHISDVSFPEDVMRRYWGAGFTDEDRKRVITHCADVEFKNMKHTDFKRMDGAWQRFAKFMLAVKNGPKLVKVRWKGKKEIVECYELDGVYHPLDKYIENPIENWRIQKEAIAGISSKGAPSAIWNELLEKAKSKEVKQ